MKKLTVLIAIVIISGTYLAQNRGGRSNVQINRNTNLNVSDNNNNPELSNLYDNVDNNVGYTSYNYVQSNNVNFNNNKIQVQQQYGNVIPQTQNIVVSRNVSANVANEDVQILNVRGNRGEVEVQRNNPVSTGNMYEVQTNEEPQIVEQQINVIPVQQEVIIDNVDNQLAINANPNAIVSLPDVNVDLSFELNLGNESNEIISDDTEKVKQTKFKEEKEINVSISMPKIDLSSEESIATKKTVSLKTKKVKMQRNFGYRQHVSIMQKFKSKTAGIKKMLGKKKTKKTKCSVVCYQF